MRVAEIAAFAPIGKAIIELWRSRSQEFKA
jgi:hypothetical protein